MAILIDGYNLLHVTGLFGRGKDAGTLQASREALVRFVTSALSHEWLAQTTIVFDAKEAPPGLPRHYVRDGGLTIRYAAEYADADELLIELIESDNAPRGLLVVTSDRQVQRAAKRRRAQVAESRAWYRDALGSVSERSAERTSFVGGLSAHEIATLERDVAAMLAEEDHSAKVERKDEAIRRERAPGEIPAPPKKVPSGKRRIRTKRPPKTPPEDRKEIDLLNPFPPGYAEDVLRDDETP